MIIRAIKQVRGRYGRLLFTLVSVVVLAAVLASVVNLGSLAEKGAPPRQVSDEARPQEPLTDVAPPPPAVDVRAEEHPLERLKALGLDSQPAVDKGVQPSDVMDVAQPPQWTEKLAGAEGAPVPPDPFKAPPIAVNPERGQADDAPLPWAIQAPQESK